MKNNTIVQVTRKGKKVTVKSEAKTARGRVIQAKMLVDSQAKNHVYIETLANKDWKACRIHLGSIDELRTFKKMIEDLESEYEDHKKIIGL